MHACDRQTDGQSDKILIAIPRLHYVQRGNIRGPQIRRARSGCIRRRMLICSYFQYGRVRKLQCGAIRIGDICDSRYVYVIARSEWSSSG